MPSDRFDRFLPMLACWRGCCSSSASFCSGTIRASETGPAETFAYWQDGRGQHQIVALLVAPLIAFLLIFFGAGLRRRLAQGNGDGGHGSVAFGGALLAAATFGLVAMLEGAMTNAAHERREGNRLHAQSAALVRLAGVERRVRGDAPRDGPRRSPQRDVADDRGLGHDRRRSVATDPARLLRVHPRSGVVDRGRPVALAAQNTLTQPSSGG